MSILQTIKQRFAEREQQRVQSELSAYREIVERLADGDEPTIDEVETALDAGDRTIEELEADVAQLTRRRELAATLANRRDAQAELQQVTARHQAALDNFERSREEFEQRMGQIAAERQAAEGRLQQIRQAEEQLIKTCRDPELLAREAALIERRQTLSPRQQQIRRDLWGHSPVGKFTDVCVQSTGSQYLTRLKKVEQHENRVANSDHDSDRNLDKAREELRGFERRLIEPMTAQYNQLTEQLGDIELELASIREQKLAP